MTTGSAASALSDMTGFGLAPIKQEGYTTNLETGESHPTTPEEKLQSHLNRATWLELPFDPVTQTREELHAQVDEWLDQLEL